MKSNSIFNTAKVVMAALSMGAMTTACTDWDDHYEANSGETATSTSSLWENISVNKDLSEFTELAKKTGYDKILSSSQTYTVWAPLNGTFDYETLSGMETEALKKQFMQNHVSHFNYPASGSLNERVFMLNEKLNIFEGNGNYLMGGVEVATPNIANSNGILHTLNGKIDFNFNIYESLNSDTYPLDSISAYFAKYHVKELDIDNSVKGPVVDGEITYLDSVFYEKNTLANKMRAYIQREDSSYTMIMPTNKAWEAKYNELRERLNYLPEYVYYHELPKSLTGTDAAENKMKELVDNNYLTDSLSHLLLIPSLIYNNNLYDNGALKTLQAGGTLAADSLVSTVGTKLYSDDAAELFTGAERINKSNGAVWITDSLRTKPWVYKPYIKIDESYVANYFNCTASRVNVNPVNKNPEVEGKVSNNAYVEARPLQASSNPELDYYIPNVMKGKYVLYLGVVPANIDIKTFNPEIKPNVFQIKVGYHDEKGNMKETSLGTSFTNDPSKVDTLRIGEIDFPVSTYGLQKVYPYVRIISRVNSSTNATRDRTLRIDFVQLIPKELDDYIKEHPDYKWEDESDK